jgi:hypothetical protein
MAISARIHKKRNTGCEYLVKRIRIWMLQSTHFACVDRAALQPLRLVSVVSENAGEKQHCKQNAGGRPMSWLSSSSAKPTADRKKPVVTVVYVYVCLHAPEDRS